MDTHRRSILNAVSSRPAVRAALVLGAVLFASLLPLATSRQAQAHAFLDKSDPAANAVLAKAPALVTLHFTEPIEQSSSSAKLYDQTGKEIPGTSFGFDPSDKNVIYLALPPVVSDGTYSVLFTNVSAADGHRVEGYIAFTVGNGSGPAYVPPAKMATSGPPAWLVAVSRWLPLLGLALLVAALPVWLLVLRPAVVAGSPLEALLWNRVRRLTATGMAIAAIGDLLALGVQADIIKGNTSLACSMWTTLSDTRYGHIWLARIGLLVLFALLFALRERTHWKVEVARSSLLLSTAALPIPFSLVSHAAAQDRGRAAAEAADWVHLLGAAVWAGGLFLLVGALLPTLHGAEPSERNAVLGRAIPRFSALALTAWSAIGLTGLYNGWLQAGNWRGLRHTSYGHTLSVKLLLLVPVLCLAAFNLLIVSPRLPRPGNDGDSRWPRRFAIAVTLEAVLVLAVLLAVGRLTSQAPARETLAQQAGHLTIPLTFQGRTGTLDISPAATGPNHYLLTVDGDTLPDKTEGLLRITPPHADAGTKEIDLTRAAGNAFEWHGSELSIAGKWQVEAIVRNIGQFEHDATFPLTIGTTPPANGVPGNPWHFTAIGIAGLLLIVLAFAAIALAWVAGRLPARRRSAAFAAISFAVGIALLFQARTGGSTAVALTASNPLTPDLAAVTAGGRLFTAQCAVCHGATGRGDGPAAGSLEPPTPPPADFTAPHAYQHYDGEFFNWIKFGKPGTAMPAMGGHLTDTEIWEVIAYIRVVFQGAPGATPVPTSSSP
jgi:copper transport protein